MIIAKIHQLPNFNVRFLDAAGETIRNFQPDMKWIQEGKNIRTASSDVVPFNIYIPANISIALEFADGSLSTFTGNATDLYKLFYDSFFFELGSTGGGGSVNPFYAQSLWTSFQPESKSLTTVSPGSNTSLGVGFNIQAKTRIKNAALEYTAVFTNPTPVSFSIHKVEAGKITDQLFVANFDATVASVYAFAVNLDLDPGIYAYCTTQDIILTMRAFNNPENIFGLIPGMGANAFIFGKTITPVLIPIPNPYPAGQVDYFGALPLAIFETELI